jgi:hypothetical protein
MGTSKWKDEFVITAYELARSGMTDSGIAKSIGIDTATMIHWKRKRKLFRDAIKRARSVPNRISKQGNDNEQYSFRDYVYDQLSPELKDLWDEINYCDSKDNAIAKVEVLLSHAGKRARQHLFIYSLTSSNFNVTKAMKRVNLSRTVLRYWVDSDPEFAELIEEINWHKKNFFEEALVKLVAEGETPAVIFANKTINKDRGYAPKMELEVKGDMTHRHEVTVSVDDLNLTLEEKRALLHKVRAAKAKTIDAAVIQPPQLEEKIDGH